MKLEKKEFYKVRPLIKEIEFDAHYVYSIVNSMQEGEIYVDNNEHPTSAFIKHSCGFAYALGDPNNQEFNQLLHTLFGTKQNPIILLYANNDWESNILQFSDLSIMPRQRYYFKHDSSAFDIENYPLPTGYQIIPIDHNIYEALSGKVIPRYYWKSSDDFLANGYGVCLVNSKGQIVSSSFSSCIANTCLDIGIQTEFGYEGHGFATLTAARMVQYALDHGYSPIWGCHSKNVGSYSVADKLKFIKNGIWNTLCIN